MSPRPPNPPNPVPEEDLSQHDNFRPIIAENGLIRNPRGGEPEVSFDDIPLQDLVQLQREEDTLRLQREQVNPTVSQEGPAASQPPKDPEEQVPQSSTSASQPPEEPEPVVQPEEFDTTFAISKQTRPTVDLGPAPSSVQPEEPAPTVQEDVEERVPLARAAQPPKTPPQQARKPRKHRRWPWLVLILAFLFLIMAVP